MKTFKKGQIYFEKKFLNELKNDPESCVTVQRKSTHLSLHPFHFNDIVNSIKDILNKDVAKYNKEFDGIVLGYRNMKVCTSTAPIFDDSCFAHVNIEADFFIFKPEVNKILHGTVSKKSRNHIGCLLHRVFNVSLPRPNDVDEWIGDDVQIGHEVSFKISYLKLETRLPYIRADLLSIIGGTAINDMNPVVEEVKSTYIKFNIEEADMNDGLLSNENNEEVECNSKKNSLLPKKSKNVNSHENSLNLKHEDTNEIDESSHMEDLSQSSQNYDESDNKRKKGSKKKKSKHSTDEIDNMYDKDDKNRSISPKKSKKDDIQLIESMMLEETLQTLSKSESRKNRKRNSSITSVDVEADKTDSTPKKKKHKADSSYENFKSMDPTELDLIKLTNSMLEESMNSRLNSGNDVTKKDRKKRRKSVKDEILDNKDEMQNNYNGLLHDVRNEISVPQGLKNKSKNIEGKHNSELQESKKKHKTSLRDEEDEMHHNASKSLNNAEDGVSNRSKKSSKKYKDFEDNTSSNSESGRRKRTMSLGDELLESYIKEKMHPNDELSESLGDAENGIVSKSKKSKKKNISIEEISALDKPKRKRTKSLGDELLQSYIKEDIHPNKLRKSLSNAENGIVSKSKKSKKKTMDIEELTTPILNKPKRKRTISLGDELLQSYIKEEMHSNKLNESVSNTEYETIDESRRSKEKFMDDEESSISILDKPKRKRKMSLRDELLQNYIQEEMNSNELSPSLSYIENETVGKSKKIKEKSMDDEESSISNLDKPKRKRKMSLGDELLQNYIQEETNSNELSQSSSNTQNDTVNQSKNKKKKSMDFEDMSTSILDKPKRKRRMSLKDELIESYIKEEMHLNAISEPLQNVEDITLNKSKKSKKKTTEVEESPTSVSDKQKRKRKKSLTDELLESYIKEEMHRNISQPLLINTDNHKVGKSKKNKSTSEDEVTNWVMQDLLTEKSPTNSSETKRKHKRKRKDNSIDELTNQLLEESLKSLDDKDHENMKKNKKSKTNKRNSKNDADDDLNVESLFEQEMKSLMS